MAEYDATIAELEAQRTALGGVMPRDQAAITAFVARLAEAREKNVSLRQQPELRLIATLRNGER